MKRYLTLAAHAVLAGVLLTGCGTAVVNQPANHNEVEHDHDHHHMTASGDIQEATASPTILPSFLDGASEKMIVAYQAAALLPEALQQVPCYCGCSEIGHKDNFNCFIAEMKEDEVIWDDHGTRCGICVDTALITANLVKQGYEPEEIRSIIDEMYGEGFGEPTPLS